MASSLGVSQSRAWHRVGLGSNLAGAGCYVGAATLPLEPRDTLRQYRTAKSTPVPHSALHRTLRKSWTAFQIICRVGAAQSVGSAERYAAVLRSAEQARRLRARCSPTPPPCSMLECIKARC
eukprot:3162127-Rhodomonas_salina.1